MLGGAGGGGGGGNYYPHYETMFNTPLLFQGLAAYLELKIRCVVLLNDIFYTVAVSSIGCLVRTENPLCYIVVSFVCGSGLSALSINRHCSC